MAFGKCTFPLLQKHQLRLSNPWVPPVFSHKKISTNCLECLFPGWGGGLWSLLLFTHFLLVPPAKPAPTHSQFRHPVYIYWAICSVPGIMKICIVSWRLVLLRRCPSVLLKARKQLFQSPFTGWSIGFDLTAWSLASAVLYFSQTDVSLPARHLIQARESLICLCQLSLNPDSVGEMVLEMLGSKNGSQ